VASLAGLLLMLIFVPFNIALANRSKILKMQKLKHQDSRIKITNEILNGIKVHTKYKIKSMHILILNKSGIIK